jgi:hypothetical protein
MIRSMSLQLPVMVRPLLGSCPLKRHVHVPCDFASCLLQRFGCKHDESLHGWSSVMLVTLDSGIATVLPFLGTHHPTRGSERPPSVGDMSRSQLLYA